MRKIKYFVVPLVVCFVIALSPCCFVSAEEDIFSSHDNSFPVYSDDLDVPFDIPMSYSMRSVKALSDDTSNFNSNSAPFNYILNTDDIVDGIIDFDNYYTYWIPSNPLDRYINHGNFPENLRKYGYKEHSSYEGKVIYNYFTSTMVILQDDYYGTEVLDTYWIEWTVFLHFDVSQLNEFDDNTDYLFDFEVVLFDHLYGLPTLDKSDNFFVLYWDGVTSGNDGLKCMSFSPASYSRFASNAISAHYRFTLNGKICNNIGRIGFQLYTDYTNAVGFALNGDFTVRAYTDADRLYDLGSENKIDNTAINNNITDSKNAYESIVDNNQVSETELDGVLSEAKNLLHLPLYGSAVTQISSWITNFVSSNYLIYSLIITALSISLCLYVLGRGF